MEISKMRNKPGIFLIVLCVLLAGGCAGNGDSDDVGPAEEEIETEEETAEEKPAEEETAPADEEPAEEETETEAEEGETETELEEAEDSNIIDVEIRNFEYIPAEVTVSAGQTVRWTNYDRAIHDVDDGSGIDSQDMGEGDVFTYTFEETGTYDYICTFHPWMEGTVIVTV